jgi:choline-sulfatase
MSTETSSPNVLFLFTDQLRPDWHGTNPDVPVRTPNLDALAERGTRFTNAVCPSPVCNPCRASLASGYEYDRCGSLGNVEDYRLDVPTYYGRLRDEAGYHVMGCGKFDLTTSFPLGLSGDHEVERWGFSEATFTPAKGETVARIRADPNGDPRGPYTAFLDERGWLDAHVEDYERLNDGGGWTRTEPTPLPDDVYYDTWITDTGIDLIDGAPDDDPWFLEVNFQNPHHPWDITERMHQLYRDPDVEFPPPVESDIDATPEEFQEVRRNYAAMVEHLDECVGRFLTRLEERGDLEDTLVVFSSDHGEMLGDHGQWQKLSPRQMSVGVPLIAAGPSVADQPPVDAPVTILDLHATFLEYAGLEAAPEVDSQSMRELFAGEVDSLRDVVYSGFSAWRMVYDGRYKLVEGYDPDLRTGATFEPMNVGPENTRRRQREREPILWDVTDGETENHADAMPERVRELHERLVEIRDRPSPHAGVGE